MPPDSFGDTNEMIFVIILFESEVIENQIKSLIFILLKRELLLNLTD